MIIIISYDKLTFLLRALKQTLQTKAYGDYLASNEIFATIILVFDNLDVYVRPLIYIIYILATIILVFDHLDVYVRPTI